MKNFLLIFIAFFGVLSLSYASFPVTEKQFVSNQQEVIQSTPSSLVSNSGGGWGIAAIACGFVGLFVAPLLLGPLAIIFGAIGLKKNLKGLAIAGLILGILELLIIGLLIGVILALA
jgi:hypothetical protein